MSTQGEMCIVCVLTTHTFAQVRDAQQVISRIFRFRVPRVDRRFVNTRWKQDSVNSAKRSRKPLKRHSTACPDGVATSGTNH